MSFDFYDEEHEFAREIELEKKKEEAKENVRINNMETKILKDLETKLQFLKNHSSSPEELELAKMVLNSR